ncbi:cell division protein FtsA [Rickettsiales bacterium]|nr:cell division protein FtsA [Rickettsiales bacterium]
MSRIKSRYIAAVDIGSAKVICLIADIDNNANMKIVGIGHQLSQGIKSGIITDIKKAEKSIRAAVGAAEEMAGVNIESVYVNISGSNQYSKIYNTHVNLQNNAISSKDIRHLLEVAYAKLFNDSEEILHILPIEFFIDSTGHITDPCGMFGKILSAKLNVIAAASTSVHNLTQCFARCHLDVEDYIVSSYASSFSCLNEDEKELGTILLDFGASNTSISVFKNNNLVFIDSVALGGAHVTGDLAIGLSTNIESAERIKTLYGNVLNTPKDIQELIDIPVANGSGHSEELSHTPRSVIIDIIRPRIDEILENVQYRLKKANIDNSCRSIVITGGASQLGGLKEYISHMFGKSVRLGTPDYIEGMAEITKGPEFSTCFGILQYIKYQKFSPEFIHFRKQEITFNPILKAVQWVKENF